MELMDDSFDDILGEIDISDPLRPSEDKAGPSKADPKRVVEKEVVTYSGNSVQVNPCQKGNPLLKAITSVPWEFNDKLIADYAVGTRGEETSNLSIYCALIVVLFKRVFCSCRSSITT
jgi:DNA excision repair protein ERCC-1